MKKHCCQKKLEISHASQILTHEPQILVLSYLSNYYCTCRTCCVHKLLFLFFMTFRSMLVHNMFCRCCELLKKIYLYLDLFFFDRELHYHSQKNMFIPIIFFRKVKQLSKVKEKCRIFFKFCGLLRIYKLIIPLVLP